MDRELESNRTKKEAESVEALQRSLNIVENLLAVSTAINSTIHLEDLLTQIVDAVVSISGCKRGSVIFIDDDGKPFAAFARSRTGGAVRVDDLDMTLSVISEAAKTGEPRYVIDAQTDNDLRTKKSILAFHIHTVICIPLKFEDNLVGLIYADADSVTERFAETDWRILKAFGAQAAVAIENARSRGELEQIRQSLEKQNTSLRKQLHNRYEISGIIGRNQRMQEIFEVVTKVGPLATTVLIEGETGTGKELIARAVHEHSPRKDKTMISVNCGALPKNLLESELFGYRKGAFTGADADRAGMFEAADGSTLFLDEIGEMPIELQVKLLRALQGNEIVRLGDQRPTKVNVRLIAATNRDLTVEAQRGNFRQDLLFRLKVVPIWIPPLRERPEDVLPLAEHFLDKFSREMNRQKPGLTRAAKEMLLSHSWTGNVRELENAIERALALGEPGDTVGVDQFAHLIAAGGVIGADAGEAGLRVMAEAWEKDYIRKMLIRYDWNVTRTANALGISRQQLHNKIKKHDLTPHI